MKTKHRFNYQMSSPERSKKCMDALDNYYDIDSIQSMEDWREIITEHETDMEFWDAKFKKLLPILMIRFSETELQIFYSCVVGHIPYTQTHATRFVTYRDKNGEKRHYTQAAINGYIKRIKNIIVREDKCYKCGIQFNIIVDDLINRINTLIIKFSSGYFKNHKKVILLRKTRKELQSMLKTVKIEKKIKLALVVYQIATRIDKLSMFSNKKYARPKDR